MTLKDLITNKELIRADLVGKKSDMSLFLLKLLDLPTEELVDAMVNTYLEKYCGHAPLETKLRLPGSFVKFKSHDEFWHALSDLYKLSVGL